jgi:hypothetical protein
MDQPPLLDDRLFRLRPSTQKGGTLIAEMVTDLATHLKFLCDPGTYRPKVCAHCGGLVLHRHDYRERVPFTADGKQEPIRIVRYRCVVEVCKARWQVLPLFLARHLWRTWDVVEQTLMPDQAREPEVKPEPSLSEAEPEPKARERQRKIPERTVRRWRQRWLRPAMFLVQVLTVSGQPWSGLATGLPEDPCCADLVAAYGCSHDAKQPMAELAALLYRLQPNIRLL